MHIREKSMGSMPFDEGHELKNIIKHFTTVDLFLN